MHKRLNDLGVPNSMIRTTDVNLNSGERLKKFKVFMKKNSTNAGGERFSYHC